jgi:hypothetical protein
MADERLHRKARGSVVSGSASGFVLKRVHPQLAFYPAANVVDACLRACEIQRTVVTTFVPTCQTLACLSDFFTRETDKFDRVSESIPYVLDRDEIVVGSVA